MSDKEKLKENIAALQPLVGAVHQMLETNPLVQALRDVYAQNMALTAERDRLKEALKPFAECAGNASLHAPDNRTINELGDYLTIGDLRNAHKALSSTGGVDEV